MAGNEKEKSEQLITGTDYMTVRQLIIFLLDVDDLDMEVIIKDKQGIQLHDVSICARKGQGLGALFG